jgi:hypothetical protein
MIDVRHDDLYVGDPSRVTRSKFTEVEDQHLCSLVEQFGECNWMAIASGLPGRTVRQCRDRWNHYLAPEAKISEWTTEEDRLLVERLRTFGKQWAKLSLMFPGRTAISIRNHCCKLARQSDADPILRSLLFDEAKRKVRVDLTDAKELNDFDSKDNIELFPSCQFLLAAVSVAPDATKLFPLFPRVKRERRSARTRANRCAT